MLKEKWKHNQQENVRVIKITHKNHNSLTVIKEEAKPQLFASTKCSILSKKKWQFSVCFTIIHIIITFLVF